MNKINFTLYSNIYELIKTIKSVKKRNAFIGEMMAYYFEDIEPSFKENSQESAIWENIRPRIKKLKIKALNGSKGGRPKVDKGKSKPKSKKKSEKESESESLKILDTRYQLLDTINNVIDKLNSLNNTKYKTNSENTIKLIKARLDEGYTEEDLLMVVEKMSYIWGGEPKKGDKDMRPYLRPSTLFRKSNFENYLNMPVREREITTADLAETMNFEGFFD